MLFSVLSNLSWRRPLVLRFHLAALKGDKEQLNQVVAVAKGKHGAEHCAAHVPWTWPFWKVNARRRHVAGRRERCGTVYGNAAEGKRSATEAL